jgi:hypothetical protein
MTWVKTTNFGFNYRLPQSWMADFQREYLSLPVPMLFRIG